jgi:Tol biopolymer transport system component
MRATRFGRRTVSAWYTFSDRDGPYHLYQSDFTTNTETKLTDGAGGDTAPQWSHDGKLLSFVRDGRQICIYDPATKQTHVIVRKGTFPPPVRIEPLLHVVAGR